MKEEFDPATKLWTTIFAVLVMLLIQWPTLLAPRVDNPPRDGSMGWTIIAVSVGLLVPLAWLVADLRRYRLGLPWVVASLIVAGWAVFSFQLVYQ